MVDRLNGDTDAPADTASATAADAANSGNSLGSFPLSSSPDANADGKEKDSAETKARSIFKKLEKSAGGEDDEDDDAEAAELDDDEQDGEGAEGKADDDDAESVEEKPEKLSDAKEPTAEEVNSASEALVRDGWTLADLKKLLPGRVLELGAKARQRQQDQDRFGGTKAREIADLRKKLAELEGTAPNNPLANAQQQGTAQNADTAQPAIDANDPVLKSMKEKLAKLGELASPEAQAVLEDALTSMYGAINTNVQARVQQQIAAITQVTEQQLVKSARKSLSEEFPDLKDDEKFKAVEKKAAAFAKTGFYGPGDMEALFRDVCATMFQPGLKDIQRKMLERSRKAKDGQVDAGQQGAAKADTEKDASPEDQSRSIFRNLQKGRTIKQARNRVLSKR